MIESSVILAPYIWYFLHDRQRSVHRITFLPLFAQDAISLPNARFGSFFFRRFLDGRILVAQVGRLGI